ncbi:MAG: DUF429 domain-containing protein, partial [Fimbriimonadaceae bacterium]
MRWVGVDGCRGGWVAVHWDGRRVGAAFHPELAALLIELGDAERVFLDVPIGLPAGDRSVARTADRLARNELAQLASAASSVFNPPSRTMLETWRRTGPTPELLAEFLRRGLSLQGWHILPKIDAADRAIHPDDQSRILEAHPEWAYRAIAEHGGHSIAGKRTSAGRRDRESLIDERVRGWPGVAELRRTCRPAQPDDILDAAVLAWLASRADARPVPERVERDPRGLRM